MRGSPLLRALLAFVVIALLGWPLSRLTSANSEPVVLVQPKTASKKQDVTIQLTFTTVPKLLTVQHLGKEVWSETAPQAELEKTISIPYPKDGVDLVFHADFPEGTPLTAMRVKLTDPEGEEHEKTLWGQGGIDDVLTFP